MPYKAPTLCKYPGCPNTTHRKYCDAHEQSDRRKSSTERGYTYRWQQASKRYLRRHPLCVYCLERDNKMVPATVVDHIVPHRGDKRLFWDMKNWQSLCKSCHDQKTADEDGAFGRMEY